MFLIQDPLVKIMGSKKFEKLKKSQIYKFIVEAFTMNVFSIVITTPNEILIAGMDFGEYIRTRMAALLLNTLTGRSYGVAYKEASDQQRELHRHEIYRGYPLFYRVPVAPLLAKHDVR